MTKMARQGIKARTQRTQGKARTAGRKDARQGMPSSSARHRQGIGNCHRQGIIGMPSASAGRRTAKRSKVAQYSHTDFERVLRCAVVKIFE
jgi:hypothetical protein